MATFKTLNPTTGEILAEVEAISQEALDRAIFKASKAQQIWQKTPVTKRVHPLKTLEKILLGDAENLAHLIHLEEGKPLVEAFLTDITPAISTLRFLQRRGPQILQPRRIPHQEVVFAGKRAHVAWRPIGVWGVIAPWNYPLGIPLSQIATLLVAGNAAVLKPSPLTPLVGARVVELFHRAGFPEDLVVLAQGGAQVGEAVVRHPKIGGILFTGSVRTGRRVMSMASEGPKKVILELGGNDPAIVLGDASLPVTAAGILWSAMSNAGQTCASVERVYVERSVSLDLFDLLVEGARQIRLQEEMGPLIADFQLQKVENHVEDARNRGGWIATGGRRRTDLGPLFYEPTVILHASPEMRVMQEETFGPVVAVQVVDGEDEAIHWANATPYGLTASVWSTKPHRARRVASQLEAGVVTINGHTYTYAEPEAPWGGVKTSGIGRTHGVWGLLEVTEPVYVDETFSPHLEAWWYPYPDFLKSLLLKILRVEGLPWPQRAVSGLSFLGSLGFLSRRISLWHGLRRIFLP